MSPVRARRRARRTGSSARRAIRFGAARRGWQPRPRRIRRHVVGLRQRSGDAICSNAGDRRARWLGHAPASSSGSGTISNRRSTSPRVHGWRARASSAWPRRHAIPSRIDFSSGHPRLRPTVMAATMRVAGPNAAAGRHRRSDGIPLADRAGVASSAPSGPSDTTMFSAHPRSISSRAAASWSDSLPSSRPDAFAKLAHAGLQQEHPVGDVLQALRRRCPESGAHRAPGRCRRPAGSKSG